MKFYICNNKENGFSWSTNINDKKLQDYIETVEFDNYIDLALYAKDKYNVKNTIVKGIMDWEK